MSSIVMFLAAIALSFLIGMALSLWLPNHRAWAQLQYARRHAQCATDIEEQRIWAHCEAIAYAQWSISANLHSALNQSSAWQGALQSFFSPRRISPDELYLSPAHHMVVLAPMLWLFMLVASGPAQWVVWSLLCIVLWAIAVTDLDAHNVFDGNVFALGIIGVTGTLGGFGDEGIAGATVSATRALMGFLGVSLVVCALYAYHALRTRITPQWTGARAVFFGEGDTLVLLALSLYIGTDIVFVMFAASALFVGQSAIQAFCDQGKFEPNKSEQTLEQTLEQPLEQPFVPMIFLGTVITLSLRAIEALPKVDSMLTQGGAL